MITQLLTAQQVAQILNVRPSTVYALCRRRELPHVRVAEGSRRALIRFRADDIETLIRDRTQTVCKGE